MEKRQNIRTKSAFTPYINQEKPNQIQCF